MKCSNCGAELPQGSKFCGKCGNKILSISYCSCGAALKPGVKYCGRCGNAVGEVIPSTVPVIYNNTSSTTGHFTTGSVSGTMVESVPFQPVKSDRSMVTTVLLNIVTFGIYSNYFNYRIGKELNIIAKSDGESTQNYMWVLAINLLSMLLSFIFVPLGFIGIIYGMVWNHKLFTRIGDQLTKRGYTKILSASDYWLWGVMGSIILVGPFVCLNKECNAMNALANDYNSKRV